MVCYLLRHVWKGNRLTFEPQDSVIYLRIRNAADGLRLIDRGFLSFSGCSLRTIIRNKMVKTIGERDERKKKKEPSTIL